MPGRKRAAVTELFLDLKSSDTKVPRVQCRFCESSIVKNGTRLNHHIEQCLLCPKLVKQRYLDEFRGKITESDSEESVENWLVDFLSKTLKKQEQSATMFSFADRTTTHEQERLDMLLARAIYASATPFNMMETHTGKTSSTRFDRHTSCQAGIR